MMKRFSIALLCAIFSTTVNASMVQEYITDGDFSSQSCIQATKNSEWHSEKDQMNTWYTWQDNKSNNFYQVVDGHAEVNRDTFDDSWKDVQSIKLMQVIEGVDTGVYNFSFDYQISDDLSQYSVVRLYGMNTGSSDVFNISMKTWDLGVSSLTSERLYDQGGAYSYLPETNDWCHVSEKIDITVNYDYLVAYAVFSYDGKSKTLDSAMIDNISLTGISTIPEPATLSLVAMGVVGLMLNRKHRPN